MKNDNSTIFKENLHSWFYVKYPTERMWFGGNQIKIQRQFQSVRGVNFFVFFGCGGFWQNLLRSSCDEIWFNFPVGKNWLNAHNAYFQQINRVWSEKKLLCSLKIFSKRNYNFFSSERKGPPPILKEQTLNG